MPIVVQAGGMGEEYIIPVPTYTCKDDLKQVVEDGMLIRNHNFVQSAELVCFPLLCTVLVLFRSHCLTPMCSFASYHSYPKHDQLASKFQSRPGDAERLQLYAQSTVSDQRALSASLTEAESNYQHWESEAKEAIERAAWAKAERDAARH